MSDNEKKIEFTGYFSPEHCRLLHDRRVELGLTYSELAGILHVGRATVYKWEAGAVTFCQEHHIARLKQFFAGNDQLFRYESRAEELRNLQMLWNALPQSAQDVFEDELEIYHFCGVVPKLEASFVRALNETMRRILPDGFLVDLLK